MVLFWHGSGMVLLGFDKFGKALVRRWYVLVWFWEGFAKFGKALVRL